VSDETTPRLDLPLLQGGQAQKHLTLNAGLMRLESLVQARALSLSTADQPSSPADGDAYILPASPTGSTWSGLAAGTFARFDSGVWEAVAFPAGAIVHIADDNRFVVRTVGGWAAFEDALKVFAGLTQLGIGTSADGTNVLAVKGAAALLSAKYAADGGSGDLSLTLNKEGDGDTAQILFQKAFSSRAIVGLLGDNDLTVKMSADGSTFVTALIIKPSGEVQVPSGVVIDSGGRAVLRTYTVSALPSSGIAIGTLAFVSNGRMFNGAGALEGAGAGTGGVVCWNGSAWKIAGTSQTVTA
jgi:hypothetical protein